MKLIKTGFLVIFAVVVAIAVGLGQSRVRKERRQGLHVCHPTGKFKELTPAGQYYKDHNHSLEGYKEPAGK